MVEDDEAIEADNNSLSGGDAVEIAEGEVVEPTTTAA